MSTEKDPESRGHLHRLACNVPHEGGLAHSILPDQPILAPPLQPHSSVVQENLPTICQGELSVADVLCENEMLVNKRWKD